MGAPHILIVDRAADLPALELALSAQGYRVSGVSDVAAALERLRADAVDLVLMDPYLPDLGAGRFIATVREARVVPILVVTARRTPREKLQAFQDGASDYITKPYDLEELLARIRVALRWRSLAVKAVQSAAPGRLVLDFSARRAIRDGRAVRLSRRECALLQVLAEAGGAVAPTEDIIARIWGASAEADEQHVRVLVWQVRRKVEPDPASPRFVILEPNQGYRLRLGSD